jgi:hypothetical protein
MNDPNDLTDLQMADSETELMYRLQQTPEIFQLIRELDNDPLRRQTQLRNAFDDALVRAALVVHEGRQKAAGLLPSADQLWLNRVGLEQSTAWPVAQYKAQRFPEQTAVHDLCSGIGVDAAALAARGPLVAVDRDSAMCLRCEWNASVWGVSDNLQNQCSDVTLHDWTGHLIHCDPDRRSGRDRAVKRLEQYQPDLHWMQSVTQAAAGGALKLGPAANFLQKFPGCDIELISLHGECREATVWFGSLSRGEQFRATALPSGETICGAPLMFCAPLAEMPLRYVYDPDPAVVRAGLLDALCERHGLSRLDAEEEYLTSDTLVPTALAVPFRVLDVLPNNVKQLRSKLRQQPACQYEIKCRRIPVDAAQLQRSLPRGDGAPRTILMVRCTGKAQLIIGERLSASGSDVENR